MPDPGNLDETVSGVRDGDLVDLLARVESASGADRELDQALWYKLIFDPALDDEREDHWLKFVGQKPGGYTASLDASLGLVERVLPGWSWMLRGASASGGRDFAKLWKPYQEPPGNDFDAFASTPALALLAALLRALIAQAADTSARNVPAREDGGGSSVARAEVAASTGVKSDSAEGH